MEGRRPHLRVPGPAAVHPCPASAGSSRAARPPPQSPRSRWRPRASSGPRKVPGPARTSRVRTGWGRRRGPSVRPGHGPRERGRQGQRRRGSGRWRWRDGPAPPESDPAPAPRSEMTSAAARPGGLLQLYRAADGGRAHHARRAASGHAGAALSRQVGPGALTAPPLPPAGPGRAFRAWESCRVLEISEVVF